MILVLVNERGYYQYGKFIKNNDLFEFRKIYKKDINSFFAKVANKLKINQFDEWSKNLDKYEKVIIFDSGYSKRLTKFLRKKNKKIIVWFWNTIARKQELILKDKNVDYFYSFDKNDCQKYNLKFNTQFYFDKLPQSCNNHIEYDVFFVGLDKGRKECISTLIDVFQDKNISYNIDIIDDGANPYHYSYSEYVELESKARCLLDIVSHKDSQGLTLRPLEAICMNKKIITNNIHIDEYNFYNPNNVFIIGKDNFENIYDFINTPYQKINEADLKYYSINKWVTRF